MRKFLIIFLVIVAATLYGQSKVGSSAAPFLNIGIGPRAIAMGGAFVATANDVSSLYWNSAGAAKMNEAPGCFFSITGAAAHIAGRI